MKADIIRQLHAVYLTRGCREHQNWYDLVKQYLSNGFPKESMRIYTQNFTNRTHQLTILILKACVAISSLATGQCLHAEAFKSGLVYDLLVGTTFVSMYSKCHLLYSACKMFEEMPDRNAVTFNAMIGGYFINGNTEAASNLFENMPTRTPVTWATMIEGFAKAGDTASARRIFDRTPSIMRSVSVWTVLVHGYIINGNIDEARQVFEKMPNRNMFVWCSLITGYFKKGDFMEARKLFDRISVKNLVSWNALISGYTQIGQCEEALKSFRQMEEQGFEPDEFTVASLLSAASQIGSLKLGKEIHELIDCKKIKLNRFILNGLVDMYAKCADLETAKAIFSGMDKRNFACWNSIISGLASHGCSQEALNLFAEMEKSGHKPDNLTFVALLSACTHSGLVDKGIEIFTKMEYYDVLPGLEHYGCLVDMLGRAGRLSEAYDIIKSMPMKPNEAVFGAFLGSCRIHTNKKMADILLHDLDNLQYISGSQDDDAKYSAIFGIYAASEKWEDAARLRRVMLESGMVKTPGCSSIMVGSTEHRFCAGSVLQLERCL